MREYLNLTLTFLKHCREQPISLLLAAGIAATGSSTLLEWQQRGWALNQFPTQSAGTPVAIFLALLERSPLGKAEKTEKPVVESDVTEEVS